MAAVTDSAFSTAGNSYLAFYNATALGPKGIAKRAAKVFDLWKNKCSDWSIEVYLPAMLVRKIPTTDQLTKGRT